MNRIGFQELHRPKNATERLEEIAARRDRQLDDINAVSFSLADECEESFCDYRASEKITFRKDEE